MLLLVFGQSSGQIRIYFCSLPQLKRGVFILQYNFRQVKDIMKGAAIPRCHKLSHKLSQSVSVNGLPPLWDVSDDIT